MFLPQSTRNWPVATAGPVPLMLRKLSVWRLEGQTSSGTWSRPKPRLQGHWRRGNYEKCEQSCRRSLKVWFNGGIDSSGSCSEDKRGKWGEVWVVHLNCTVSHLEGFLQLAEAITLAVGIISSLAAEFHPSPPILRKFCLKIWLADSVLLLDFITRCGFQASVSTHKFTTAP